MKIKLAPKLALKLAPNLALGLALTLATALSLALTVSTAVAQPEEREGIWFGGGLGLGYAEIDCGTCGPLYDDDPWEGGLGLAGHLAVGRTISERVLANAGLNFWARRSGDLERDATLLSLGLGGRFYPAENGNFYLAVSLGLGFSILAGGNGLIETPGFAAGGGVGYDIPVGSSLAISPFIKAMQIIGEGAQGRNRNQPAVGPGHPAFLELGIAVMRY